MSDQRQDNGTRNAGGKTEEQRIEGRAAVSDSSEILREQGGYSTKRSAGAGI